MSMPDRRCLLTEEYFEKRYTILKKWVEFNTYLKEVIEEEILPFSKIEIERFFEESESLFNKINERILAEENNDD